jgi:hypothetical protein
MDVGESEFEGLEKSDVVQVVFCEHGDKIFWKFIIAE